MTKQTGWELAKSLIKPRSRFGFLFGVTQKDIDRAVAKLSMV